MQAACLQLCSGTDIKTNLENAGAFIREAAANGASFIVTPEMTHILQKSSKDLFSVIVQEDQDLGVAYFGALAKELNITLLIGSLAIQNGEARAVNRSYVFGHEGEIVTRYDKIHLFDVTVSKEETWQESRIYDAGTKAVIAEIDDMKVGLSICYDLRFPHLFRTYAQQQADVIAVPAAFTRPTGRAHWETLLRARAIETGAYILAPAQGGDHEDGRKTWGHSMVIDPWGDVIAHLDHDRPGIIYANIDREKVRSARTKIPAWSTHAEFSL